MDALSEGVPTKFEWNTMNQQNPSKDRPGSVLSAGSPARVAVVGAGIAGLSCARELRLRGIEAVVFEASGRLGGRCSSRATQVGTFDDAAQCITGASRLASYAVQRPGELAAVHAWTVPMTPAEDARTARQFDAKELEEETDAVRTLKLLGAVGVPSMLALAHAIARPLELHLHTPIVQVKKLANKRGDRWLLHSATGPIEEPFAAVVLALPAPLALPLAQACPELATALATVRYRSRWVLLLGSARPVGLPGYREFQGSPIERVSAMHSKPGRPTGLPQRWFIEADERWSLQHEHDDAETVAELLLDIFRAHARRKVTPNYLCAVQWKHAFVATPAALPGGSECFWDSALRIGACGDSLVASQVDRVHASGVALALAMADGLPTHTDAGYEKAREPQFAGR
jgi:renalase